MALVKCKECGNDVARDATRCPKCGTKMKMGLGKKLVLGVLGAFAFLLFVGMVGSKGSKSPGSANVTPELQPDIVRAQGGAPGAAAPKTASNYEIGHKVEFADSSWVVLSATDFGNRLKSNNSFQEAAQTDGRFISVTFSVHNKTSKEERIIDHPVLVDSKGREFRPLDEQAFYIPKNKKTLALEALPASMTREFFAIYEVAADAVDLRFGARELSFSPDVKFVALRL